MSGFIERGWTDRHGRRWHTTPDGAVRDRSAFLPAGGAVWAAPIGTDPDDRQAWKLLGHTAAPTRLDIPPRRRRWVAGTGRAPGWRRRMARVRTAWLPVRPFWCRWSSSRRIIGLGIRVLRRYWYVARIGGRV